MRWPYPNIGVLTTRAFRNLLNKIFGDIGSDLQEQKSRVDNLITSNPQPSEVEDMRTGRDGQTYPVARDMVLGEIGKTEAAQAQINQDTVAQLADEANKRGDMDGFRPDDSDIISKMKNEFTCRGVNAAWYIFAISDKETLPQSEWDWKPAIDLALQSNGKCLLPNGEIKTSGNHDIRDNFALESASYTKLTLVDNVMASIIRSNPSKTYNNVTLRNVEIDCGYNGEDDPEIQKDYHAINIANITGLVLFCVTIRNPIAWCTCITNCHDIQINNFKAYSEGAQQDGLHLVDCTKVAIDGVYGDTGDDVLGITVDTAYEIFGYTVSNVQGTSKIGSLVRLNQSNASYQRGESKLIRDMIFTGLLARDCGNRGFSLADVHPTSIVLDIWAEGTYRGCSREGVRLEAGKRMRIKADIISCGQGQGIAGNPKFDSFWANRCDFSTLDVNVYDVADGTNGVRIDYGNHNDIIPKIDYNPNGKTNVQMGVKLGNCNYNKVRDGNILGCLRAVQLGSTTEIAQRNKVFSNLINDCSGYAIAEGDNSDFNEIYENSLVNTQGISRKGEHTRWWNNPGFATDGKGSVIIPAGSLSVTISHGLYAIPKMLVITPRNGMQFQQSRTGSTFTISISAVQSTDTYFDWIASTL